MIEKFMLAISLATTGIWLPYDHQIKPADKAEEYYASVRIMKTSGTKYISNQILADRICCYTNREVMAYYNPNDYTPKNFYYTYDSTHPLINCIVPLNNDINSVSYALFVLERESRMTNTLSNNDLNNITLGYLRSFRKDYSGDEGTSTETKEMGWRVLAGLSEPVQNSWSLIEAKRAYHDSVRDFFARYAENDRYYSKKHGNTNASVGWKNSISALPDPCGDGDIDIIHLFASIDGALKYTYFQSTDEAGRLFFPGNMNHDILGWGGDLQSCMQNEILFQINTYNTFDAILEKEGSPFSISDLLADIDAFNIAKRCDDGLTLQAAFIDYYDSIQADHSKRYRDFVDNVVMEKTYDSWNGTKEELFRMEVHMMLAQKYTSNGYEDVYNDSSRKIVYHLIKTGSYEQRFKLAELFSSYILSKTESVEAD